MEGAVAVANVEAQAGVVARQDSEVEEGWGSIAQRWGSDWDTWQMKTGASRLERLQHSVITRCADVSPTDAR